MKAALTRTTDSRRWIRRLALIVLAALAVPLLAFSLSSPAQADGPSDDADNFSLYKLASNASAYFGNQNAPGKDGGGGAENLHENWTGITEDSGDAGSMLGYADSSFSFSMEWLFNSVSGSSQTLSYDAFKATDGDGQGIGTYNGLMDYVHFGAANNSLGFDSMSGNVMGDILNAIGGSIVWFLYVVALGVSWLFFAVIQVLKFFNPFLLFEKGVAAIGSANGNNQGSVSQEWADGMTTDSDGNAQTTWFTGLADWVSGWYGALQDISWGALVPLFIGFTILALVMFKKMDRGSMLKKLMVRIVFIAVGLPLIGGMYTSILSQFDDELGQHAGPTRVVLSTYVDFNSWMTNSRLAVPDGASISWDANEGAAQPESMLSARSSALAINSQSNSVFKDVKPSAISGDAKGSWTNATPKIDKPGFCEEGETCSDAETDENVVGATIALLGRYISGQAVSASDFESGVKSTITQLPADVVGSETKADWFIGDKAYGDSKEFGEGLVNPFPAEHPLIATAPGKGLYVDNPGGTSKVFKSNGEANCGYKVVDNEGLPANCNMSPLAAYNYLNTGFTPTEFTAYSSNKATSGFTRENHMSVSQVGTGVTGFMYWSNTVVLLSSIVLIGIFYALGMLTTSIKRTIQVIAAIPFATLGAISAISKVIIYSVALIMEVILTLFLYQFVSEFLISLPSIIEGPIAALVSNSNSIFSNDVLGTAAVVVMTLFSTVLIIGVTFVLLKVRKTVLEAVNEMVTKVIDKFMDSNTPPPAGGGGPGLAAQAAGGLGTGAGMAASNAMMGKFRGGNSGGAKGPRAGKKSPNQTAPNGSSSNVSGTNGPALAGRGPQGELPPGNAPDGGHDGPNSPAPAGGGGSTQAPTGGVNGSAGSSGNDGRGGTGGGNGGAGNSGTSGTSGTSGSHGSAGRNQKGADGSQQALPAGKSGAGQLALPVGRSAEDKAVAQKVGAQGGLSRLGVNTTGASPKQQAGAQGLNGTGGAHGSSGTAGNAGSAGNDSKSAGQTAGKPAGSQAPKRAALGSKGASQNAPSNLGGNSAQRTGAVTGGSKQPQSQVQASGSGAQGAQGAQGTPTSAAKTRMRGATQGPASVSGTNAASAKSSQGKPASAATTRMRGTPQGPASVAGTNAASSKSPKGIVAKGAAKGAASGAIAGAQVGKFVPGVGTAVATGAGAAIGGVKGGVDATKGKAVAGPSVKSVVGSNVAGKLPAGNVSGTVNKPAGVAGTTSQPVATPKRTAGAVAAKGVGTVKDVAKGGNGGHASGSSTQTPRRAAAAGTGCSAVTTPVAVTQAGQSQPATSSNGKQSGQEIRKGQSRVAPTGTHEGGSPISGKPQAATAVQRSSSKPHAQTPTQKPVRKPVEAQRPGLQTAQGSQAQSGSTATPTPTRKSSTSATQARQQVGNQPNRSVATGQQPVKPAAGKGAAPTSAPATKATPQVKQPAAPKVQPATQDKAETTQPTSRKAARQAERFREAATKIEPIANRAPKPDSNTDNSKK